MRSASETLNAAARALADVSDTPRLDAEVLLAHALGVSREALILNPNSASLSLSKGCPSPSPKIEGQGFDRLSQAELGRFDLLLNRRLAHEPVAYITGTRGFWTIDLEVTPDVLIPRADSETLIVAAVAHFGKAGPKRILDLGTGSGALLLAALDQWPEASGVGIDVSDAALAVARSNAERIAPGRAEMRLGDWGEGIAETFELILCNPPYVEDDADLAPQVRDHEPAAALFAGPDGLDAYRILAPQFPRVLAPGGIACIEIGSTQAEAVTQLLEKYGNLSVACRTDLAGLDRCLVAKAI